jgi:hypothetical protein
MVAFAVFATVVLSLLFASLIALDRLACPPRRRKRGDEPWRSPYRGPRLSARALEDQEIAAALVEQGVNDCVVMVMLILAIAASMGTIGYLVHLQEIEDGVCAGHATD